MKRLFTVAGLLVLTLALPLRADTPELKTQAKPVKVPFELFKTKHIGITIKINGKGPYRVIFDTGAPVSILSNKVAEEANLIDKNAPKPLFNPFGAGGEVKIKTLEVGDLTLKNVPAMVMDHPGVQAMSRAFGPVEGIIGFPFFSHYQMTIDYQAKEMTFLPSDYKVPDSMQAMMSTMMAILSDPSPTVLASAGQWGLVVTKKESDDRPGVSIKEVRPNSAAAAAGLKAGDRLLTLDDRWTDSVPDAYLAASFVKPGTEVEVVIKRDGKEMQLTVKPAPGM